MPKFYENHCQYLLVCKNEKCNKLCKGKFCGAHNRTVASSGESKPCWKCGRGTTSRIYFCDRCYPRLMRERLKAIEKKAKQQMKLVLEEIKEKLFCI